MITSNQPPAIPTETQAGGFSFVVEVQPDWNLLGCNLETTNNFLAELIPTAPEDSMLYLYRREEGFAIISFLDGQWSEPETTITPGTGFWFRSPVHTWLEFRGEVVTGTNTVTLARDYNLVACPVTRSGNVSSELGFEPDDGDMIYQYVPKVPDDPAYPGYYVTSTFDGIWLPRQPFLGIGSGMWIRRQKVGSWTANTTPISGR